MTSCPDVSSSYSESVQFHSQAAILHLIQGGIHNGGGTRSSPTGTDMRREFLRCCGLQYSDGPRSLFESVGNSYTVIVEPFFPGQHNSVV